MGSEKSLPGRTATELVGLIRAGEISSREVVDAHIQRIEEVDGRLHAVVVRRFDEARAEADAADLARARGDSLGPLHGAPITIKEQFLVEGTATTFGLPSRASHRAERDGPLVARLRAAGAIVLGKTNVGELLMYHESNNPLYGQTNNPWNLARTPGGSSGGEAAIVAAGGSALGLGGDLGGSIRIPAHFCGIAGLKPTSGRLTNLDTPAEVFFDQDVIVPQPGPLARRVSDLALAMSVLAAPGQEAFDRTIEPRAWPDPAAVDVSTMRFGAFEDDGWFSASPAIRRAVREAAAALEARGATVVPFRPPEVEEGLRLLLGVLSGDGLRAVRETLRGQPVVSQLKPFLALTSIPRPIRPLVAAIMTASRRPNGAQAIRASGPWSAVKFKTLANEVARYRERYIASLEAAGIAALICPPHALPALTHGAGDDLTVNTAASYAAIVNVLGFPAGVVPATRVRAGEESDRRPVTDVLTRKALLAEHGSAGLPVGVQVVARPWREDVVLATMTALEGAFRANADFPAAPPM